MLIATALIRAGGNPLDCHSPFFQLAEAAPPWPCSSLSGLFSTCCFQLGVGQMGNRGANTPTGQGVPDLGSDGPCLLFPVSCPSQSRKHQGRSKSRGKIEQYRAAPGATPPPFPFLSFCQPRLVSSPAAWPPFNLPKCCSFGPWAETISPQTPQPWSLGCGCPRASPYFSCLRRICLKRSCPLEPPYADWRLSGEEGTCLAGSYDVLQSSDPPAGKSTEKGTGALAAATRNNPKQSKQSKQGTPFLPTARQQKHRKNRNTRNGNTARALALSRSPGVPQRAPCRTRSACPKTVTCRQRSPRQAAAAGPQAD